MEKVLEARKNLQKYFEDKINKLLPYGDFQDTFEYERKLPNVTTLRIDIATPAKYLKNTYKKITDWEADHIQLINCYIEARKVNFRIDIAETMVVQHEGILYKGIDKETISRSAYLLIQWYALSWAMYFTEVMNKEYESIN